MITKLLLASIVFTPMPKTWTEQGIKYCPRITVTDLTGGEWLPRDKAAVETSKKHCKKYFKSSPCVSYIIKTDNYNYDTTCTQKDK